jgi:methyl-accepting chemotaxis protein
MNLASSKKRTLFLVLLSMAAMATIAVMATLQYRTISHYRSIGEIKGLASDIQSNLLNLRRNEKDFLARKDPRDQTSFGHNFDLTQANTERLTVSLRDRGLDDTKVGLLAESLADYRGRFQQVVKLQQQIGFHHEDGYYGSMRESVHRAERILQILGQDRLLKDMLMLRRHEKDFMLRRQVGYLEKFDSDMGVMREDLTRAYIDHRAKREILSALNAYETDFKALASATREMGFSSDDGLHRDLHESIQRGEETLEELRRDVLLEESKAGSRMINQLIASAIVLTILITALIRL